MKLRKTDIWLSPHEMQPVRIVGDAGVSARGVFGGRLVPLVILDTSERPDIDELIRVHHASPKPGDVKIQWAERERHEGNIALILTFVRPVEARIIIEFDIAKQGVLVEQALSGKGLYIQAGRDGDRLIKDPQRPKILVEVVDTGFKKDWDSLFQQYLTKMFRDRGLSRSDAKRAAKAAIAEWQKLGSLRMRDVFPEKEC